jgi:CheY-like chemotaxis protein
MPGTKHVVLMVDDDPQESLLLREAFEDIQAPVIMDAVVSAAEARQHLRRSAAGIVMHPTLVILDLLLPDGNGVDLADELFAAAEYKVPRMVLLTGNTCSAASGSWSERLEKPASWTAWRKLAQGMCQRHLARIMGAAQR